MKLIELYESVIASGKIANDPNQRPVAERLQYVLDELASQEHSWFWQRWTPVKGIYIYGPVGGGKTFLMDMFYQALPDTKKARYHFHQFMQLVDEGLRRYQGHRNPVECVASDLISHNHVLCLDEFSVQDVTQASVLVLLLKTLFKRRVTLVMTSNTKPNDLYLNGMNRERFLPAIDLIYRHCDTLALTSLKDYRYLNAEAPITFVTPLGARAQSVLTAAFQAIEPKVSGEGVIEVQRRQIPYLHCGKKAIWFDFSVICQIPRCQLDYLELANRFEVFFVSNVPALKPDDTVPVLLLMYLVDVLYDQNRRLMMSSAVEVEKLYAAGPMSTSFERTKSRLVEMQSIDYLED